MLLQQLLVVLIVTWCCVYAVWALLPDAARRACARRFLAAGLPGPVHRWMQRKASGPTGCACDGCDAGAKAPRKPAGQKEAPAALSEQPIRIHRRLKR